MPAFLQIVRGAGVCLSPPLCVPPAFAGTCCPRPSSDSLPVQMFLCFFLVTFPSRARSPEQQSLGRTCAARSGMNGPAGGTAAASDGDNNDVHLSRKWRDDRWLKEHEGTGLTEANVLDYFALSEW